MRKEQIHAILRDNPEIWEKIKRREIAIDKYIFKLISDDKYLYIETQEELLNIPNRKKPTKIFDLWNKKKATILVK